jgi:hypothetical protein
MSSPFNQVAYQVILPPDTTMIIVHNTRMSQVIQLTWTREDGRTIRPKIILNHGRFHIGVREFMFPRRLGTPIKVENWPPMHEVSRESLASRPQIVRLRCALPAHHEVVAIVDRNSNYFVDFFGNQTHRPPDGARITAIYMAPTSSDIEEE